MRNSPSSSAGQNESGSTEDIPHLSSEEYKTLLDSSQSLHTARNATKARVLLVEWPAQSGRRVVLKDGTEWVWWFRTIFGRYQMQREWEALKFLKQVESVPSPCFRAGADAFGMEWSGGEPLLRFAPGELPPVAIEKLETAMSEFHALGVTHGDLHRDNVLFDASTEKVWIIDWATACVFGTKRWGFKAWMWREWQELDLRALAKIKVRYTPELLRDDERVLLEKGGTSLSRLIRRIGSIVKRRKRTASIPSPHASA